MIHLLHSFIEEPQCGRYYYGCWRYSIKQKTKIPDFKECYWGKTESKIENGIGEWDDISTKTWRELENKPHILWKSLPSRENSNCQDLRWQVVCKSRKTKEVGVAGEEEREHIVHRALKAIVRNWFLLWERKPLENFEQTKSVLRLFFNRFALAEH